MSEDSSVLGAIGLIVVVLSLVALAKIEIQDRGVDSSPVNSAAFADPQKKVVSSEAVKALREGRPMDLNAASTTDLELLPRIGPKLAQRIVDDRQKNGPYKTVKELMRVRGIGPAIFGKLEPMLTISDKKQLESRTDLIQ
jgi:competence ComEA-like helix-hairpin-helix protein